MPLAWVCGTAVVPYGGSMRVGSVRHRLERVPAWVIDAGWAVAVAVAVTIAIRVAREPGARPPDLLAYALGWTIGAVLLARRRWPVAVLVASFAAMAVYYLRGYVGISAAVPLAVALYTAGAAGHLRWALLVAAVVVGGRSPTGPWWIKRRCWWCSATWWGRVVVVGDAAAWRVDPRASAAGGGAGTVGAVAAQHEGRMIAIMATGLVTRTPNTTAPPVLTKPAVCSKSMLPDLWPALRRSGLPPGRIDNTFPHRRDRVCLVVRLATRWARAPEPCRGPGRAPARPRPGISAAVGSRHAPGQRRGHPAPGPGS